MKKTLLLSFFVSFLFSCNKGPSPKETAATFIKALSNADLATAASLTSAGTKAVLDKAKKERRNTADADESFRLSSLAETVADNKAEVRNDVISIRLVKEKDGWKVALNETLLNEVQNHDELVATAKSRWEALAKEYDARLQVLQDYIRYKKDVGSLSPKIASLNNAVASVPASKAWTKETITTYAQKQQQLNQVIDEALEPSMAANTDLSMSYFLQISTAGDRIKAAENEYQLVARKAHSSEYVPLPFKTADEKKVNSN